MFDVDFTLFRPGPELGPEGYRRVGERHGLTLEPSLYEEARVAAIASLQANHALVHDEEIWIAFTEQIVLGMGGDSMERARARPSWCASGSATRTSRSTRTRCRCSTSFGATTLKIGLISNGQRDLEEFAEHHVLEVDAVVGSKAHGRVKPHASIFVAALEALDVSSAETVMVGDSYEDDIEGARALGIRAILLDRDGLRVEAEDRIDTLLALPAALGLARP